MVVISLSNCGGIDDKTTYSGLQVEHVELRSMGSADNAAKAKAKAGTQGDDITRHTVERAATPAFSMESSVTGSLPITRIAWSKDNTFLAALALSNDTAHITVWNMKDLNPSNPQKNLQQERTTAIPNYTKGNLQELSIGLAISPDGDQVAVYQEPKIGQWADGSDFNESEFQFLLLFPQPSQPGQALLLEPSQPIQEVAEKTYSITTGPSSIGGNVVGHHSTTLDIPGTAGDHCLPHYKLKYFIGYGAFFPGARKNNLGMASSTTCPVSPSAGNYEGNKSKNTGDTTDSNSVFVACNGIYIDVFTDISGSRWRNTHSISLTDLIPTISRRVTCKMMMDAMSRNKFMWLEVGGACCSIWGIQNGSNVSYIFNPNPDNAKLGSLIVRSNKTMSLSPDESMAVVAAVDGSLTTFYVNTGVTISNRKFPDQQIEYVAFSGQNSQLFVMTRSNVTLQLKSWILDPLQLHSGIQANQVPVPIIGRTIQASFEGFGNTKFVFEADRSKINCYVAHKPVGKIATTDSTRVKPPGETYSPTEDVYEKERKEYHKEELLEKAKNKEEPKKVIKMDRLYEVRTAAGMKLSRDDDDSMYWILRVEVVERYRGDINEKDLNEKVIFSFVPEPWMRISAADVRRPEDHQKVYFLPGRSRFVVVGMQTLQIWSLPTKENSDLSLLFIWSRPKVNDDLQILRENLIDHIGIGENQTTDQDPAEANLIESRDNTASSQEPAPNSKKPGRRTIETELVGEFYHYIRDAKVYFDRDTGEVEARITLKGGFGVDTVRIPGERSSNNHSVFLNCAQSIHLLAASYAYSDQEDKFSKILARSSFTFKEHADAIVRFTRGHINRLLHSKYFKPLPLSEAEVYVPRPQVQGQTNQEYDTSYELLFPLRSESSVEKSVGSANQPSSAEPLMKLVVDFVETNVASLWTRKDEDVRRDDALTILALLLSEDLLEEANHSFIEGLLKDGCEWIPHPILALDLIERVIDIENKRLLKAFLDYCIKNAHEHHPGYLTPVIQCQSKLSKMYPDIMGDLFRRASYIPVRNSQYVASHAVIAKLHLKDWSDFLVRFCSLGIINRRLLKSTSFSDIHDDKAPIFSLRFQLPFHDHTKVFAVFILVFFVLVVIITVQQIRVSSLLIDQVPTPDEIAARYLPGWQPVFIATIAIGFLLIIYELLQVKYSPRKYFGSPYNYVDLAACIFPVVGCFILLRASPGTIREDTGIDGGPSQIWMMGFGILLLYLNLLFELRIFKQLGVAVNIIFNISRRIKWFILIFAVILVSFTHALLYLLHTRRYRACQDGSCDDIDYPSNYPTGFFKALLSGRYDPVETSLEKGSVGFQLMMVIFYFFTAILLLNVLIALMNDAFDESKTEGEVAHWKLVCEVLIGKTSTVAEDIIDPRKSITDVFLGEHKHNKYVLTLCMSIEVETQAIFKPMVGDYDPGYIYYCASEDEVKRFHSGSEISIFAYSSRAAHKKTHEDQYMIKQHISEVQKELADLKELVKCLVEERNNVSQDYAPYPRDGALRQEPGRLEKLVEELVLQLKSNNSTT
ncbi:hypothetical protein BGX34_012212 [Mortierella sp. NVP85]|nr:hypothetical protein BGX34_012212 [Mortierella sp. NVP85]